MNRNQYLTRRLLNLSADDLAWVSAEANAQFLNSAADGIEDLDYLDFLENGLDLVFDPAYRTSFTYDLPLPATWKV